jgi:5S rRNA maturation endonuclease (ribonuclease M5)
MVFFIGMRLVIVESPTKARTLKRFLGSEYTIEASMGHIRDLPKSTMGVDVNKGFEPDYEVSKGKSQVISSLKKAAASAEAVILATDPDREGEAISWHIKNLLQQNGKKKTPKIAEDKFKRVTFHEITKDAIDEALTHPGELNMALSGCPAVEKSPGPVGGIYPVTGAVEKSPPGLVGRAGAVGGGAADCGAGTGNPGICAGGILECICGCN